MATNLKMVTLPTISQLACQLVYGRFITTRMVCAMVPAGGKSTCQVCILFDQILMCCLKFHTEDQENSSLRQSMTEQSVLILLKMKAF